MNKDRRQRLSDALSSLDEAIDIISEVRDEEQEAFDNMPEGLQCSSRGEAMMEAMDHLDGFSSSIEDIKSEIEDFVG